MKLETVSILNVTLLCVAIRKYDCKTDLRIFLKSGQEVK